MRKADNIISRAGAINSIVFWISNILVGLVAVSILYIAVVFTVTELFGKDVDFTFIKTGIDFIKNLF